MPVPPRQLCQTFSQVLGHLANLAEEAAVEYGAEHGNTGHGQQRFGRAGRQPVPRLIGDAPTRQYGGQGQAAAKRATEGQ